MSDATYEQLFKRLIVHAPDVSVPLAMEFINTAYSRALALHDWSALRALVNVYIPAAESTGTLSMTQGSSTITGVGTAFTSDMEGRQVRVDAQPYFTILSVQSPTSLTVDRAWVKPSATGLAYEITLSIITTPSDFGHFISFVDPENNWKLHTSFLSENIDQWDAERTSAGTSFLVVPQGVTGSGYATIAAGLRRFELWPRPSGAHVYSYSYIRKPPLLNAYSDRPIWPIRGDVIRAGAIAELCKWPGSRQTPNPHFDLNLSALYAEDFRRELGRCAREDQEVAPTNISYDDPFNGLMFAPLDARFIQSHDIVTG
jgi:hypothetical protein